MTRRRGSYSLPGADPSAIGRYTQKRYEKKLREVGTCKHCERTQTIYPRGLCFKCYMTSYIRVKYAKPDNGEYKEPKRAPLPKHPTCAMPGSPEKIAVMMERAAAKRQLFHPDDGPVCVG